MKGRDSWGAKCFFPHGNSSNFGTKANTEDRKRQTEYREELQNLRQSMPQLSRTKSKVPAFPSFPSQERMASTTQKLVATSPSKGADQYCRSQLELNSLKTSLWHYIRCHVGSLANQANLRTNDVCRRLLKNSTCFSQVVPYNCSHCNTRDRQPVRDWHL